MTGVQTCALPIWGGLFRIPHLARADLDQKLTHLRAGFQQPSFFLELYFAPSWLLVHLFKVLVQTRWAWVSVLVKTKPLRLGFHLHLELRSEQK